MADDYLSSNPFRRKSTTPSIPPETPTPSNINHIAYQHAQPLVERTNLPRAESVKKIPKKVRMQSPPPPSPSTSSVPGFPSAIAEDVYTNATKRVTQYNDPFDGTSSTSSEDEADVMPSQAPHNPFSKTLATMERTDKEAYVPPPANVSSLGRSSMDVEAFKRLLMTGNAGLGSSTPPTAAAHFHHGLGDGGSSTDASSISRQSIYEPVQESHTESPRTSHEISEPEDDRRRLTKEIPSATLARKKPPPPSSRHGKLIKLELRDNPSTSSLPVEIALPHPPTPNSTNQQYFNTAAFSSSPPNQSSTDLNKPLPPAPKRASHDSDRESIFDKESAGKTPEPPSPSASVRRKTPPAPPLTRRHSQLVSESKITRETGRLSPKAEEESHSTPALGRPRSDTAQSAGSGSSPAPPPPPTRRASSARHPSYRLPAPQSSVSLPPPTPPARGSSRSISASGRPPSVASVDMGFGTSTAGKRVSMAPTPPPPPPPRQRGERSCLEDESRRMSGEMGRRSAELGRRSGEMRRRSGENGRRATDISRESTEESSVESPLPSTDIQAELDKLRRDIDESLRASTGS